VTAGSTGTLYVISNTAIATITGNGQVTPLASGTALVQATHEGTSGFTSIKVVLTADTDADGIADDLELELGLNPNNAADALEDPDRDGLNNRGEADAGTDLRNPDSDGDGIFDGEEVVAGTDGFITNPLLADTDGDGVRDGLEIATGTNPLNPGSINLGKALKALTVTPEVFTITVNSVLGEGFRQLTVTGVLQDGTLLDLTSTTRGTNYTSSDLDVCNFGSPDGRVFGGESGTCTITVTNSGHTDTSAGTVIGFRPQALSFVSLPGFANNVDVSGSVAYVAAGAAGLQVVNVANKTAPALVATLDTSGNANDVQVLGGVAYVADGAGGLQVISVSNPLVPVLLGTYDTPGDAWDVVVSNNRAYVADGEAGLLILDVTNPAEPTRLGSINPTGIQKGVAIDPLRKLAVLASGTAGIHVIDVTDPTTPVQRSALAGGDVRDVALQNQHAFLADYERSFTSVDLTDPTSPVLRASTPQALGGRLHDVVVQGNFGLGADVLFVNGVPIVAIDAPDTPIARDILSFAPLGDSDGQGVAADAGYVYLAAVGGSAFTENGSTSGASRLYIGQYLAIEDRDGVPPTVAIVQPPPGITVIEGTPVSVRVNASDDVAVAAVTFTLNGAPVATDGSEPYEVIMSAPAAPGPMLLGASAVDFGNAVGTATPVPVTVIPDPLTSVTGRIIDVDSNPVEGATVALLTFETTSASDGTFTFTGVPTVLGKLVVRASKPAGDRTARGASAPTTPVPSGTTNVGDIRIKVGGRILLLWADYDAVTPKTSIAGAAAAAGLFTADDIDTMDVRSITPTLDQLREYGAVMVWSNYCFANATALGDVLANYVDEGGGVVTASFAHWGSCQSLQGRLVSGNYIGFVNGGAAGNTTLSLQPFDPATNTGSNLGHPIMAGVSGPLTVQHTDYTGYHATPGATIVARDTTGNPKVAIGANGAQRVVSVAFWPHNFGPLPAGIARLFANALDFVR
jgi:hypothetical protein